MSDTHLISFAVNGTPVAKGSARAFVVGKRAIITAANGARQKPWASAITHEAALAMQSAGAQVAGAAVAVQVTFLMPRPKAHYRTGRHAFELRPDAPVAHTIKPDIDKLTRLVLDALTGVVWRDDSQVAAIVARKVYTPRENPAEGVTVRVTLATADALAMLAWAEVANAGGEA